MKDLSWKEELGRKFFHLLLIPILAFFEYLRYEYDIQAGFRFLLLLCLITLIYDYLRLRKHLVLFRSILRSKENIYHATATTTLLGMTLALAAFDYDIAKTAIGMVVLGDLSAGLVRKAFVKDQGEGWKSFAACFLGSIVAGMLFLNNGILIVVMSFVASWVEAKVFVLDDNLFIVLFAGATGQLIRFLL